MSFEVSIISPLLPVCGAFAINVSPVHVTMTAPAARSDVTVNMMALLPKVEVLLAVDGEVMEHKLIG